MKKTLLFLFIAVLFTACANKNEYSIDGSIDPEAFFFDTEGINIYLQKIDNDFETFITLDSSKITDGKFSFKEEAADGQLRFVTFDPEILPGDEYIIPFVTHPGVIKVSFAYPSFVNGTPTSDAYNKLLVVERETQDKLMQEYAALEERVEAQPDAADSLIAASQKENKRINLSRNEIFTDFIRTNINNDFGKYLLVSNGKRILDVAQVREVLEVADADFKELESVKRLVKRLQGMENSSVGKMFTDFTMHNAKNEPVSLSDYVGKDKFVLIDFWASWCAPCRADIPHLIELYKKYKNKGLEIVAVSLDSDGDAWLKAMDELKMPYPQMSDLKAWDSPAAILYGIESIPYLLLLDKEGMIIDKDLRGKELEEKLAEVLK